jgi:hypothetical protein
MSSRGTTPSKKKAFGGFRQISVWAKWSKKSGKAE